MTNRFIFTILIFNSMHNFSKIDAAQIAVKYVCEEYDNINPLLCGLDVPLSLKIEVAKRISIKQIINNCQCESCIEIAYQIHELNLLI
jgi:hypothetical protein